MSSSSLYQRYPCNPSPHSNLHSLKYPFFFLAYGPCLCTICHSISHYGLVTLAFQFHILLSHSNPKAPHVITLNDKSQLSGILCMLLFQINFESDLKITKMVSGEGEVVPFKKDLYPRGNVEDWLLEVENVMKESLRIILLEAIADYKNVWCSRIVSYCNINNVIPLLTPFNVIHL